MAGCQAQAICALPQERERARKGAMQCVVRGALSAGSPPGFKGNAGGCCKRPIHPGKRAFYYAEKRLLYGDGEDCGKAASGEFSAPAFDEDNNTSM